MKKYTFAITQTTNEDNENTVEVVDIFNNTNYQFDFVVTNTPNIIIRTINNDPIFDNTFIEDSKRTINGLFGYDFFQESGESTYMVLDTFLNNPDTTTTRRMDVLNKEVFTIYFTNLTDYTTEELSALKHAQSVLYRAKLIKEAEILEFGGGTKNPK